MSIGLIILIIGLCLVICGLFYNNCVKTFKVSYYEQILKNNSHLFSEDRYKDIQEVMDIDSLKKLLK